LHSPFDYLVGAYGWRHLLGVAASAALLSLGAPFWFNILKSITNLRTVLARKNDEERGQTEQSAS